MALGLEVTKQVLDVKAAQAVLKLRAAFEDTEDIAKWLSNHPVVEGVDPLISDFGYTTDEAYILRFYFESFDAIRINNGNVIDVGRKITGLE
jgi:4-hydroxy-3-methylbut-2-en-1-yl diphosphate synthase IspG/GcpE